MNRLELLQPGDAVGRYVVLDLLGEGGMAAVYRVRHDKLGSLHALKVVTVPSRSVMRRLMLEGQAQARLAHRNIVAVTDVIEVQGNPGLIMEYVRGPSLHELLYAADLPLAVKDGLARGMLRGLHAAHQAGLVHRDLKPANILIALEDDGLVPKIADFGLAKDAHADSNAKGATRSGTVMGTPSYMAPEQIRSAKNVDARADVFSVAAVLYELLTGRQAYPGEDMLDVFNRIAHDQREPLPADLPERMRHAIDGALLADLDARVPSAQALLELWCSGVEDAELPIGLDALERLDAHVVPSFRSLQPPEAPSVEVRRRLETEAPPRPARRPAPEIERLPASTPASPSVSTVGLGLLATTTTGALIASGLAMALGLIGLWVYWPAPERVASDAPPTPTAPAPIGSAEPAPPRPEPPPAPLRPDAPAPVRPTLPAPIPAVPVPVPAAPAPTMPVPAVPAPAPVALPEPDPEAPITQITVTGDMKVLLKRSDSAPLPPGELAPGTYEVTKRGTDTVVLKTLVIAEGQHAVLDCQTAIGRCRRLP